MVRSTLVLESSLPGLPGIPCLTALCLGTSSSLLSPFHFPMRTVDMKLAPLWGSLDEGHRGTGKGSAKAPPHPCLTPAPGLAPIHSLPLAPIHSLPLAVAFWKWFWLFQQRELLDFPQRGWGPESLDAPLPGLSCCCFISPASPVGVCLARRCGIFST